MGIIKRIEEFFSKKDLNSQSALTAANPGSSESVPVNSQSANHETSSITKPNTSSTHYLAFDLEIAKVLPGIFNQWKAYRPLGITCAATLMDGYDPMLWYSRSKDGSVAGKMNQEDLIQLVEYLNQAVKKGWQILTWNGLGFDFDVLAEESDNWETCQTLASNHTDMMFHIICAKGYPLALDKAAKGMGLSGKTEGMTGELAPVLWQQGQYQKVLEYVSQDVRTTLGVAKAGIQDYRICWTSNQGNSQSVGLPQGWLTIRQALMMPLPDNSWMDNPLSREDFLRWTTIPHPNIRLENPQSLNPPRQTTSKKQRKSSIDESESDDAAYIEKINALLSQGDRFDAWFIEDIAPDYSNDRCHDEFLLGCPCPICKGAPNLDPIFRWLVDPDPEKDPYDDWYYDDTY